MHEFGITSSIAETALRIASENGATKVLRVDLLIGQLTFLSVPQVRFAYEVLAKGTLLEGSELAIQEATGLVECQNCHHLREIRLPDDPDALTEPLPLFACPECSGKVVVVKGKECQITGMTFES
ncbi:MAG: hydrogenase maturation nickel metallochaperone HypA [Chloroflexi bacterium]|nr:hydrogenase maturation nickel metallochaperone HypA [Chloroflexota bacterium]